MVQENTEKKVTFNIDKNENFSEWFTEICSKAELADIRYDVKGMVVFQSWSVFAMEKMYDFMEKTLQAKGHEPVWFPALIPEKNFKLEEEHVKGFAEQIFWVTESGLEKLEEKLGLRPTSETAFYQMYALWIRSYNDLPFKKYQRANVFRYGTDATRPFLRSREFHWIEAHCAFATQAQAEKQVRQDMQTTIEVLTNIYGIPLIFFKRPQWDKFPGAQDTFAADCFAPSGRVVQQPSTHLLSQNFSKPFNVKYTDKNGKEKNCYTTCYGPAISRIFGSVIATHGDNKGLIFPFEIAPKQVVIVPIMWGKESDEKVIKKANSLYKQLNKKFDCTIDLTDKRMGEKFYYWEMKGVPIRIELGEKELNENKVTLFRRDTGEKIKIDFKLLKKEIQRIGKDISRNLREKANKEFESNIVKVNSFDELKTAIANKKIAKADFCSIELTGEPCSLKIKEATSATVRGLRMDKEEKASGNCVICGKKAELVTYIAKQY